MQIKYSSICKLPKYSHIFLDNIRETKENVIGHGSLTCSALSPMWLCLAPSHSCNDVRALSSQQGVCMNR